MPASPAEKNLRRVLLISAIDGWSIALFAGLCTLIALLFASWISVIIGALITAAGVIELRGRGRLVRGDPTGMSGLVGAQLIILGTIWLYSLVNLITYNEAAIVAKITPELRNALSQSGFEVEDLLPMLKPAFFGFYLVVMGVTLLFQGGLALYYHSRRPRVVAALTTPVAPHLAPPALPQV